MMMMGDDEGEIIIPMKDPYHPSTITAVDGGKGSPGSFPTRTRTREIEFALTAEHTAAAKVNKDNDDNAASATNQRVTTILYVL